MSRKTSYVFFSVVVIALVLSLWLIRRSEGFGRFKLLAPDATAIEYTEQIPREEPYGLLATEDRIFVQYSGVINVYSVDGEFICMLRYYTEESPDTSMGYEDGLLYIKARGKMYLYDGTQLVPYHWSTMSERTKVLNLWNNPPHSNSRGTYVAGGNKLILIDNEYRHITLREFPKMNPWYELLKEVLIFTVITFCAYSSIAYRPPSYDQRNADEAHIEAFNEAVRKKH